MTFWIIFVVLALSGMAAIAVVNTFAFPRLQSVPLAASSVKPHLSVLIPARNEAKVIGESLRSLLDQPYPHLEVIVLDDHSTDHTAAIVRAIAQQDQRLRLIPGKSLPSGWLGKNWACHQLAGMAAGEWLLFTDADVLWAAGALPAVVAEMSRTQADLLTVWPTQHSQSWGERLVVPLMALVIMAYLPVLCAHHTRWSLFAAANGQCLAFRRQAYQAIGGHTTVRDNVLEDVTLARRIKAAGLRLRMTDGAGLVNCRMYTDWSSVRAGYAKNILAGYGGSLFFLGLATVFHWLVFLLPWIWLVTPTFHPAFPWPLLPLLLISLGVGVRLLTAAITRQRLADALLMPVSVLLMTGIAAQAVWWHFQGGPKWKGRTVRKA